MCRLLVIILLLGCASPAQAFLCSQRTMHTAGLQYSETYRSASSSSQDEARRMKEEAERIRAEVASFEKQKKEALRKEEQKQEQIKSEKLDQRMRYSALVPILKGDGSTAVERVDFPPRFKDGTSRIEVCTASLPLGIILGESEEFPRAVCVDEVTGGSNGEMAGVKEGDLLRACTACQVTMETPTWQLMVGGIGVPKTKRFMFSVDGRPFEEVMDAVASNRMDPDERPVVLVVERR